MATSPMEQIGFQFEALGYTVIRKVSGADGVLMARHRKKKNMALRMRKPLTPTPVLKTPPYKTVRNPIW